MIIIGEKINSTLKSIRPAMESWDTAAIQELAQKQYEAGAAYIDVNAGMFVNDEPERLEWLVKSVNEVIDAPLCIDTPNPVAMERALKAVTKGRPIVNSITLEKDRYCSVLPLVTKYNAGVIALCMDDEGMPETVDQRFDIAKKLISGMNREGVKNEDIYIDPMVRPIGTGSHYGVVAIETIRRVKEKYPDVHIACGLSNISFGIPARKLVNQAFLVCAMQAGMDGAIMDPLDTRIMSFVYATEALLGIDEYCMNYIEMFREGKLDV